MMRTSVAVALGCFVAIFGFAVAFGLSSAWAPAVVFAALVGGATAWIARARFTLEESAAPRALRVLSAIAAVLAVVSLGRLAVYMVDPSRVAFSSVPHSDWEVRHSCLSAYAVAGQAVRAHPNVYDHALYSAPDDDPAKPRKPRMLGSFRIDAYEYPPPFLLLPRALQLLTPEFLRLRALWFGLNGLLLLGAFTMAARFMGPAAGTRALLLSPLIWMALPVTSVLQKGNVQCAIIAAGLIAMALIDRGRRVPGAAILAFATASKLYPGLLIVHLVARRDWRAVAWTAGFGALFVALTLLDVGVAPFRAFREHLPGLMSGEAFPAFRNPAATAVNYSIPGLVFKLRLFGVPGMTFVAMKLAGWAYTLVAIIAVVLVSRRPVAREERPLLWLALLVVATLRSPFLPQAYAGFPAMWLLTLVAASLPFSARVLGWTLAGWAALNVFWPLDWPMDPRLLALLTGIPQAVTVLLAVTVLWRLTSPHAPRAAHPSGEDHAARSRDHVLQAG